MNKLPWIILGLLLGLLAWFFYRKSSSILHRVQGKNGTEILIVKNEVSEGLPHTSDSNTIVIPENVWKSDTLDSTLRHELVHIDQKRNLETWYTFYKTFWDYTPYKGDKRFDLRPNPDTADQPLMVWRDRWIFVPEYSTERTLRSANVRVLDLSTNAFVPIPDEWRAFFEEKSYIVHQNEHPHEIAAEFLTNRPNTPAANLLYEWEKTQS